MVPFTNTGKTTPSNEIISSTEEIVSTIDIPGMNVSEKVEETDGLLYQQLSLPNEGMTAEIGKPQLPQIGRWFAIPKGAKATVEVVESTFTTLDGYYIYPAQKPLPEDGAEEETPFDKDTDLYSKDEFYPAQITTIDPPQGLRGLNASVLRVIPFQFNPVTKQLKAYSNIKVKVSFAGGEDFFLDKEFRTPESASFYVHLLNFADLGPFTEKIIPEGVCPRNKFITEVITGKEFRRRVQTDGDATCFQCHAFTNIIITHSDYAGAAEALAKWNNAKGVMTKYVTTQYIGSTTTAIKNFIISAYNKTNFRPSYITILGDVSHIPTYNPSSYVGASDLYYVTMDVDYTPDIRIGRIPVTPSDALGAVNKIINYEKYPYTGINWYDNALIASDTTDFDQSPYWLATSDAIKNLLIEDGYICNIQYYGQGGSTGGVISAINSGVSIVNHRDHGQVSGWQNPSFRTWDISSLSNGNMLPVMFSMNCFSGSFQNGYNDCAGTDDCFGSCILKQPNKGVVGFIGSTDESWTGWNDWMNRGFYDARWPDFYPPTQPMLTEMGDILDYGKSFMLANYYDPINNFPQEECEMFHYLGSPTMSWRTQTPTNFSMCGCGGTDCHVGKGNASYRVHVCTGGGWPAPGAMVTLQGINDYLYDAKGSTNSNGDVVLTTSYSQAGTVERTITKYDYAPHIESVTVINNWVPGSFTVGMSPANGGSFYTTMPVTAWIASPAIDPEGNPVTYSWRWKDPNGAYTDYNNQPESWSFSRLLKNQVLRKIF